MKLKQFTNLLSISAFLLVIILFIGCSAQQKSEPISNEFEIPALLDRNENLRMGKEWDDVMSQYQKLKLAINKDKTDHESKIRLAQLFIREARVTGEHGHYYNAALEMTDMVLNDSNIDNNYRFLALLTKGGVQLSHHDFSGALVTGNEALVLNPANPQVYGVLVDAHVELGKYDKAIVLADRMIALKPDLRSYARISYIREIHGEVDQAMNAMKLAIEAGIPGYEDTAWAMLTYAELKELYNQDADAKKLYEEILAQRPNYPFAIAGLGKLALNDKNYKEAIDKTKQAIDIIPEVGFYIQMAEIQKELGMKKELAKNVSEILAMLKDDEKSGHNMNLEYANLYLDVLEDPKTAFIYAEKEYKLRPKNIDVNKIMGKVYNKLGDKSKSNIHYTVAKSTNSKHPDLASI